MVGGILSHLPASSSSCWFQSNEPIYLKLNQQVKNSSTRKAKMAKASPWWVKASPELARRSQGFSSYADNGRESGHQHNVPGIPGGTPRRGFALAPLGDSQSAETPSPAGAEISICITHSEYSPLVQEVLEAQLCLLVPSPPAKPNPIIY